MTSTPSQTALAALRRNQRPSVILAAARESVLACARSHGASNVRVFGSVARGDDTETSDIDLLVDFPPGTSLLEVIGLEQDLHAILGVAVDVGPADALRTTMRERAMSEAKSL